MLSLTTLIALFAASVTADPRSEPPATTPQMRWQNEGVEVVTFTIPSTVTPSTIPTAVPPDATGRTQPGNASAEFFNCSERWMPRDDFESINEAIKAMADDCSQLDMKIIPARTGVVWRSTSAQVYWCNYAWTEDANDGQPLTCQKSVYDESAKYIDDTCGDTGGGWMTWNWLQASKFTVGRDPRYDGHWQEIAECGL